MNQEKEAYKSYESLEPLFNPHSIAILGASENKYKIGYMQIKALLEGKFKGKIYPIHRKAKEIEGLTCFTSLQEVPDDIDLAIFCLGADQVRNGLEQCASKKVKAAIIFASGFSETGPEGRKVQQELAEFAKRAGIRIIGPNGVGLINLSNGLIGTFSPAILSVPQNEQRGVGYASQSGAFGVLTYMAAAQNGLSFNYFVSVGNEMETEFEDVLEYMLYDSDTKVISGYLEGSKNPDKLKRLAKEALNRKKPIIVMKTGRSSAGSRAAASHTGSLAGSDEIYDAFFKQSGIVRADDYEDIISFSKLFLSGKLPNGKNTVILTSSGGRGINEADRCESYGLHILPLKEETKAKLQRNLPAFASVSNPVDLTAAASVTNPELFLAPLQALIEDPDVDNILLTEFPYQWNKETSFLHDFINVCKNSDKFVLVSSFPLEGMSLPPATEELVRNGIPVIPGNLNPVKGLAKLVEYSRFYKRNMERSMIESETKTRNSAVDNLLEADEILSESQAGQILESYGIPNVKRLVAGSETEAMEYARKVGYPVAMKIDSPDIPHKTEADAIRLSITTEEEARQAYRDIVLNAKVYKPDAKINGVSIQEMLPAGVEVIVGSHNDPVFGPVVMFGLGGIYVEVYKDISFRIAPLTKQDALEMIDEVKGKAVLTGARGKKPMDLDAIADVLVKVSDLVTDCRDSIQELDINPLIVSENGLIAVDAMIVKQRKNINQTVVRG